MKFYGQQQLDQVIASYFPGTYTGLAVEVGSYNGVKGSNTLYFEQQGWNTILIEPNPTAFTELKEKRQGSCYNVAISNYKGTGILDVFTLQSGIQSSLTSLKPDPRLLSEYWEAISERKVVEVTVTTLDDILDREGGKTPDFITIDTEGTEFECLQGLNLDKYRPHLIVVENNYRDLIVDDYLENKGYVNIRRHGVNDIFRESCN